MAGNLQFMVTFVLSLLFVKSFLLKYTIDIEKDTHYNYIPRLILQNIYTCVDTTQIKIYQETSSLSCTSSFLLMLPKITNILILSHDRFISSVYIFNKIEACRTYTLVSFPKYNFMRFTHLLV